MYNVAIIGAGQLGSRHLQALKLAASPLSITVMDSSEESLRVSEARYNEVSPIGKKTVNFVSKIESLPSQLDLVIIATGSKPRANIVKDLLKHAIVKYMVLEKILFPKLEEYDEILTLIKQKKVKCWVNCNRRMFGLYKDVKEMIDPTESIIMSYSDENWGLCCNAIHIIDIFMYLTGESSYTIDVSGIDNSIEDSKRGGYIEMTGSISLKTINGSTLSLISENNYIGEKGIKIVNGENTIHISETNGSWSFKGEVNEYNIPYQSQLTGLLADEILITGGCSLSTFGLSIDYHKPFIEALLLKYNELTNNIDNKLLPIT